MKALLIILQILISISAGAVDIDVRGLISDINAKRFPSYSTKRTAELIATNSWRALIKAANINTLPDKYKMSAVFVKLAIDALDKKENPNDPIVQRVNRLVNDLKANSLDPSMSECFKIYFIDDKNFDNAFTTTCHIFMTRGLLNKLNDNQLRAVIAHEMGHGALGHFPKAYEKLFKTVGSNILRLPIEEVFWLLDGQFHGYIGAIHELYVDAYEAGRKQFYDSTSFRPTLWQDKFFQWFDATTEGLSSGIDAILERSLSEYGASQDTVELEADVAGAVLLQRSGFSGEDLISALLKLENVKSEYDLKPLPSSSEHSPRQYPSLFYRIKAIRTAAK
ncbi:MAG: M48 family metalloprotease [Bdellovibrionales bacterium]